MKVIKKKINLKLMHFFLILLLVEEISNSKCGADKIKLNPINLNSTNIHAKRDTASGYQPIKLGADFTSFRKPSRMSSDTFEKVKRLILETFDEFAKFIKIIHEDIDLSGEYNTIIRGCEVDEISSNYRNFLITNDVIVFPSFNSELGSSVLAAAGFCLTYGRTGRSRPIAGILLINPNLSFNIKNSEIYMKKLLLHEITHILIFSPNLLKSLGMLEARNSNYYVTSPKALLKARQHFNCASITGIPLENQGGEGSAGSHWESRYMLGDYMISTDYNDNVLSDITLALFEDSGFYQVNYYTGGLFKFGKNKGCSFLNKKCIVDNKPISEEFCIQSEQPMCLATRTYKGFCGIYDYSKYGYTIPSNYQYFDNPNLGGFAAANYCPIAQYSDSDPRTDYYPDSCQIGTSTLHSDYGEKIGENSFCFVSSLLPTSSTQNSISQSICYEVECNLSTKSIIVKVGQTSVNCPTSGGDINIDGYKGSITCPKFEEICSFDNNVLCNEMFDCLNKKVETASNSYEYDSNYEDFQIISETDSNSYEYDPNDEDFQIVRVRSKSSNLKINNFILLFLFFIYFF